MDYNKTDYSQYATWQPIQTANGGVQYLVPGTEWAYDPFVSAQTGRVQLFRNHTQELDEAAKTKKDAKDKASPLNQVEQLALPLGVAAAGKYAYNHWIDPSAATQAADAASKASGGGFWNWLSGGSGPATSPAASPASAGDFNFDTPLAQVLDTQVAPSGTSTAMARLGTDALNEAGKQALSQGAQAAGQQVAPESTGFMSGLTATAPGTVGASFLPALGIAAGAYTGMQQFGGAKNAFQGKKLTGMQQAALALPTFGASLLWNHIPGLTHVSTKEQEQKRWGKLADKGITGAQEAFLSAHSPDSSGKWEDGGIGSGKEWNWEDAVSRAKVNPSEFRLAYGNLDTFGNDWATYDPKQQDEIVKRLIDANLYDPEKGDITISDKDAARKIKDEVLSSDPQTSIIKPPSIQAPSIQAPSIQPQGQAQGSPQPSVASPAQWGTPPTPASPGVPGGFKPLPIGPPTAAPQVKTVNVAPPPPPQDVGKQLADRFNSKFGARY